MATVPANTYPFGYAKDGAGVAGMGTMLTIAQLETKTTVKKLHPEFWRRYRALMEHALTQGIHLGVGTGWRIQPNPPPPGFASPGNSNHEGFPADGVSGGAVAIDTVCDVSWQWMEVNLKAYGLRSFKVPSSTGYGGSNEPWHIQPAEIPAGRMRRTQPWNLPQIALPTSGGGSGGGTTPPPPTSNWAPALMQQLPITKKGHSGLPTKRVQHFLALAGIFNPTNMANFDGQFGSGTENGVKSFQANHYKTADGIVGPVTWDLFCAAADGIPTLTKGVAGVDVARMQRMLSANGFMEPSNQANFDGQFGSGTDGALKRFQSARKLTADGICGQKSWTSLLNG